MMSTGTQNSKQPSEVDFEKLIETPEFKALVSRKNKFMAPYVVIFMITFFLFPILTGYTTALEGKAIGMINWTWMYAWGLFAMTWIFSTIYTSKASSFDKEAEAIVEKHILK